MSAAVLCAGAMAVFGASPLELKPMPKEFLGMEYPFAARVTEKDRQRATEIALEATRLFGESLLLDAAKKYQEAIAVARHPAMHYNLAFVYLLLDRSVDAHTQLLASMELGLGLLSKEHHEHAKNYVTLLEKQLVHLKVKCDEPGAAVMMNGRKLFDPPGSRAEWITPGQVSLVASKEGYLTNEVNRYFEGGARPDLKLDLGTLEARTRTTRRWDAWKPWVVLGSGAVVAAGGGGLYWAGRRKIRSNDEYVNNRRDSECKTTCGGTPDYQQGRRLEQGAIVAWSVGGAAIVTGAVLAFMNRAQTSVVPYDVEVKPDRVTVAPMIDVNTRGVAVSGRF